MASLGVSGDPDGWLHAGDTMNSVIRQLEDELGGADGSGGTGLRPHWYGPVADAYQDAWQQRRQRYDDLIGQARPAVSAISDFGHRMLDFQRRAADLEHQWLRAGLVLTGDGLRFTLPAHASLAQDLKATLEPVLGRSERDIAEMWHDIEGAVEDLVTVLRSATDGLEDFRYLAAAAVGFAVSFLVHESGAIGGFVRDHAIDFIDEAVMPRVHEAANASKEEAAALSKQTYHHGDAFVRAGLRDMKEHAAAEVTAAGRTAKLVKFGGGAATAIGVVQTGADTYFDIKDRGVAAGLEANAGDWTTTAVALGIPLLASGLTDGMTAGLTAGLVAAGIVTAGPVLATVGVIVATSVVAVGVGKLVQYGVDHHVAIGHAVDAGVKDLRNLL